MATKVTYRPRHPGDPHHTEWDGHAFKAGEAVEFDLRRTEHKRFVERVRGNPWFEVDGESAEPHDFNVMPTTPDEYRGYAIDWMQREQDAGALKRRWDNEADMREAVGWGSDDDELIAPILQPRIENLERMDRER